MGGIARGQEAWVLWVVLVVALLLRRTTTLGKVGVMRVAGAERVARREFALVAG